jgi:predicted GNAT superfamily acetyltransferase
MGSCHHLTLVHRKIWVGEGEGIEPVPTHVLITLAKNGGLVLGAYAEDGPPETNGMVGFIVGWLATPPYPPEPGQTPHLKHCSHIAGVLPDFQGRGAGVLLKLAQREEVLAQRITNHVTWTYDPLYRVNGALNIHRLGAVCTTYLRDVYGQMDDALNAGAPTDRCMVDWYLDSSRVQQAIGPERLQPIWSAQTLQVLPTRLTERGLPEPISQPLKLDGSAIAMPLPDNLGVIRSRENQLLITWRYYSREVFESAFGGGYALVDCVQLPQGGWYYILAPAPSADH